jgi:hypothetical protein
LGVFGSGGGTSGAATGYHHALLRSGSALCKNLWRFLARFDARQRAKLAQLIASPSLRDFQSPARALIFCLLMNNLEFIQEREEESCPMVGALTGWETVVFQVEDVPPED